MGNREESKEGERGRWWRPVVIRQKTEMPTENINFLLRISSLMSSTLHFLPLVNIPTTVLSPLGVTLRHS